MAEDEESKTEEPTDKKIEDAKKEGNVSKSTEVIGAAVLLFGSMYLLFLSSFSFGEIKKMMIFTYSFIGTPMNGPEYFAITATLINTMIYSLAPLLILVVILTLAFSWMQFGMIMTPLKLDLQKLDPIKGFGNVFSLKKLLEALKLFAKLTIIFVVMVVLFLFTDDLFIAIMDKELIDSIDALIELTAYFLATILLIIIIFAIIDFYFTRHYYFKSLRMTKQEIKDEYKNVDGDPLVKGRIRQIQHQMHQKRMMSDVPDADVVITNPTHYAIAMKYDNSKDNAPLVVAKGIDFIAQNIKKIARENDIPIIENPSLARALYDQIEIDQHIPEEFYKTVAEIFGYVYELKNKRR
ncbi:MAG: flagellar biosynthesis protein FlhB [Campylobacterota bacterium]|nr:flagellar biosynthesis protein FlhB [Campylobacterota bacterium]